MRPSCAQLLASVAAIGLTPVSVYAQSLPGPADPGRIDQRFETPAAPQSAPPVAIPAPSQVQPPEQAAKVRFTLRDLIFDGVTVYETAALRGLAAPLLGKEISLLDLYGLRDALTKKYRADGYVLSQVVLPAQKIADGVVKLQAVEGFVADVRFEGAAFADRAGLLTDHAEKIKASKPLRLADLERYVLLTDDLPGLQAKTVLKPAEGVQGGAVLTFVLTSKPITAAFTADNRGSQAIGPFQLDGTVDFDDLTGFFESTRLRVIGTPEIQELLYIDVAETVPVGSEGTTVTLNARRSWSEPGADVSLFELDSRSLTVRAGVSHPFIRSRSENLRGSLTLTARESETQALDEPLSEDHLRIVSAGLTYDVADSLGGVTLVAGQVHKGLEILGASERDDANLSRAGGRADFHKLTGLIQRHQPLFDGVSLLASFEGQWSPFKLLSSEEYGIGGASFGSAFDYSELTGDSGAAGRVELQYTPDLGLPLLPMTQLYAFTDGGGVWNHEEDDGRHGWQTLWSAGFGLRLAVTEFATAAFEAAIPIAYTPAATGDQDWRGFFSLTVRY